LSYLLCLYVCACVLKLLCNYMLHMYLDFHTLYLFLFPLVLFCPRFAASPWSPLLMSSVSRTWKASSTRPFTTPRLPSTTQRSLSMPMSSIAPRPSKSFDNRRPRRRSRASIATLSVRLPLNQLGVLHLNGGYVWTRELRGVHPYLIPRGKLCPHPQIRTQMSVVPG
jgi:hypothetical protein